MRGNVVVLYASPQVISERRHALVDWFEAEIAKQREGCDRAMKSHADAMQEFREIQPIESPKYRELAIAMIELGKLTNENLELRRGYLEQLLANFEHERDEIDRLEMRSARFIR
jgi:hypothetical protein